MRSTDILKETAKTKAFEKNKSISNSNASRRLLAEKIRDLSSDMISSEVYIELNQQLI